MTNEIQLIPGEAFTSLGGVANNLIDKLSSAVGYIFVPRGKRKDAEEAIKYLKDYIKNDESIPPMAKAAAISSARKMIRQYINQTNIVSFALDSLSEQADVNKIENDWLINFMDKAGNVSNEEIQVMLGKLLAEECNKPNSVSRTLVNILMNMDAKSADIFKRLRSYIIMIREEDTDDTEPLVVIPDVSKAKDPSINVSFEEIIELTSLGLIEYNGLSGYVFDKRQICFEYGDKVVMLNSQLDEIPIGQVGLTRYGKEFANAIILERPNEEYFEKTIEYWKENGVEINIL